MRNFTLCMENGDRHFRIATILESNQEYGNGVAHLILGSEEYLKAVLFLLETHEFGWLKAKEIRKLVYRHDARHAVIRDLFSVWISLRAVRAAGSLAHKVAHLLGGIFLATGNHDWWIGADKMKQHCLYVTSDETIREPASFNKKDYNEAKQYCELLKTEIYALTEWMVTCDEQSFKEFKQTVSESEIFELLKESINKKES